MEKDSKIPDGRPMTDYLARKINEGLNNKRVTPEDELADVHEEMARDIDLQ